MPKLPRDSKELPVQYSKKSPTGPAERTPKPEYLYNSSSNFLRSPLVRSHSVFDGSTLFVFCFLCFPNGFVEGKFVNDHRK